MSKSERDLDQEEWVALQARVTRWMSDRYQLIRGKMSRAGEPVDDQLSVALMLGDASDAAADAVIWGRGVTCDEGVSLDLYTDEQLEHFMYFAWEGTDGDSLADHFMTIEECIADLADEVLSIAYTALQAETKGGAL